MNYFVREELRDMYEYALMLITKHASNKLGIKDPNVVNSADHEKTWCSCEDFYSYMLYHNIDAVVLMREDGRDKNLNMPILREARELTYSEFINAAIHCADTVFMCDAMQESTARAISRDAEDKKEGLALCQKIYDEGKIFEEHRAEFVISMAMAADPVHLTSLRDMR